MKLFAVLLLTTLAVGCGYGYSPQRRFSRAQCQQSARLVPNNVRPPAVLPFPLKLMAPTLPGCGHQFQRRSSGHDQGERDQVDRHHSGHVNHGLRNRTRHRDQSCHSGRPLRRRHCGCDVHADELHHQLGQIERTAGLAVSSSSYQLALRPRGCVRENFLRRAHRCAVLDRLSCDRGQHVLERRQNPDRIQIIVVADVGDAEQLALHVALSVGHHCRERLAEFLHDLAGVESRRSIDRGQRGARRRR